MRYVALFALALVLPACPATHRDVPCVDTSDCNQLGGGSCDLNAATGTSWCSYPDDTCASGRRWGDTDIGDDLEGLCQGPASADAGVDASMVDGAPPDALVDAATLPAYDIAYPSQWTFSVSGPATGFVLIANTSSTPLSLSTFQVTSVSDNHPTAVARVTSPSSPGTILQPHTAGGSLSQLSDNLLRGSGLVMESWADRDTNLLSLELLNAPAGTYDVAVSVTVSLDGRDVAIPMTIHVVPGPVIYLDPQVARRVSVFR
ncbi:MAG: hypothetical protein K8W52_15445 [Deltaproteobacteria bacterium]|nr:hypothetical protein [Deltaproteobacteria bacterium]